MGANSNVDPWSVNRLKMLVLNTCTVMNEADLRPVAASPAVPGQTADPPHHRQNDLRLCDPSRHDGCQRGR